MIKYTNRQRIEQTNKTLSTDTQPGDDTYISAEQEIQKQINTRKRCSGITAEILKYGGNDIHKHI